MTKRPTPQHPIPPPADADALRLIHELKVHQVELEMQHEELVRSRAESEAARRRYTDLFDFAPVAYLSLNRTGHVIEANQTTASLTNVSAPLLVGRPLREFVAESERAVLVRLLDDAFATHARQRGEFHILADQPLGTDPTEPVPIQMDLLVPVDGELCLVSLTDLTQHLRSEAALREMQRALHDSQRMEAIGRLAGGIAHDFNNLLTIISGYAEVLHAGLGPSSSLRESVDEIALAGTRAAALTKQLLTFSRKQPLALRVLDLGEVVRHSIILLQRLIGEHIVISHELPARPMLVRGDAAQLEQVVINLAVNARDAMPLGGTLSIHLTEIDVGAHSGPGTETLTPGRYVLLVVRDTGEGMARDTQARAFEPFFTTKPMGSGTGLGLSIAYGIVQQAAGAITIESRPKAGTTMRVLLPLLPDTADATQGPPNESAELPRGTETILVAEDEVAVRTLAARVLRRLGYIVLVAPDGAAALALAERYPEPIHLLLSDVIMPHLSGRPLAEALRAARPGLRVLFASGYTDDVLLQQGLERSQLQLLQKPYTLAALAHTVRNVLDTPETSRSVDPPP
jgi:signal transduction histidine kinase/CheY-like chemotaxis protein